MNIWFPTILFFRIQRCRSFPFQPRSHTGPLINSLGCFSKFPRIPMLSYTPNIALFSFQRSTALGDGRVSLTWNNLGTPRKKLLQASGTWPHKPLPATQERLPAIALLSPLQHRTSTRGRASRGLPGDSRTLSAGVTRVLTARSHLGFYPGNSWNKFYNTFLIEIFNGKEDMEQNQEYLRQ